MDERSGGLPADDFRRAMQEPVFNRILKQWVGRGELEYEVYLKTETLLNLHILRTSSSVRRN